jgi:peptide/nickel transport system substrate-binding protein
MKFLKTVLTLLFLASIVLTACGGPAVTEAATEASAATEAAATTEASATEAASASGGTVIIGTPQEPGMMNTLLTSSSIEDAVVSLFGEGLVSVNEKGEYVPVLAKELPTVSEDGLVVTWKLLEGVKWSDGSDFTCDDVKFTMEGALSDLSQVSAAGYRDIETLECPDPYTVVATFGEVYAPYLRLFSYTVPDTAGALEDMESWDMNRNSVGTGPFMLTEWVAGDHLTFSKNPYYREEGKPYLDSVIIKILPSREVGMQLLGTGEIHALWDLTEANFPELQQLESQGVSFVSTVTGENELLSLNFGANDGTAPADPSTAPHPILYDLKVRQALQYAIDKQQIVDALLYGNVNAGNSAVPVGTFACPQPVSEFSLEKANALLDEAGWTVGADGIREKDGVRMSLKIATTTGNQLREQTEQVLAEMLKAAGIELVIENVPSDVLFAGWESDGMRDHGTYDIVMYTTGPSTDPDSHLYSSFHSSEIPTADNEGTGANFSRYINADVDAWLDEAGTITDTAARKDLYCKVIEQVNKDLPRIYLYERLSIMGHRNEFQGLKISPTFVDFAWDAANWTLDQ